MARNRHPLRRYCLKHGISLAELGRRAPTDDGRGLSRSWVNDIVNGRYAISAKAALQLHAATEGEVAISDLLTWRQAEQRGVKRPAAV